MLLSLDMVFLKLCKKQRRWCCAQVLYCVGICPLPGGKLEEKSISLCEVKHTVNWMV